MNNPKDTLQSYSTDALATELLSRSDLFEHGMLRSTVYSLLVELGVVPCADAVPLRKLADGTIEAMAIIRNTGVETGKLCSVGGRILLGESPILCLRRNVRSDIGCELTPLTPEDRPYQVFNFARRDASSTVPEGWGTEYHRQQVLSLIYPILLETTEVTLGSTPHGGQEASAVAWFSREHLPPMTDFGYGQGAYYQTILDHAHLLLP